MPEVFKNESNTNKLVQNLARFVAFVLGVALSFNVFHIESVLNSSVLRCPVTICVTQYLSELSTRFLLTIEQFFLHNYAIAFYFCALGLAVRIVFCKPTCGLAFIVGYVSGGLAVVLSISHKLPSVPFGWISSYFFYALSHLIGDAIGKLIADRRFPIFFLQDLFLASVFVSIFLCSPSEASRSFSSLSLASLFAFVLRRSARIDRPLPPVDQLIHSV